MSQPYYTGSNPSTTLNQAALGNQMGSYGQGPAGNYGLQGGLGIYLADSIGKYLQNVSTSGNWGNIAGVFGDKGATYANNTGSLTGFDSGLGAIAGAAGGLLDRGASHQRTDGKYGHIAQSVDTVANVVGSVGDYNPLATGLGRLGMGVINNITGGTDGMTVQDSLLGSGAVSGTLAGIAAASATNPVGWAALGTYALASGINAATGKTTTDNAYKSFMDKDKLIDVASGYTDMDLENEASMLYNKKYGGFSRGAYKKAQKKINEAQMRMTDKLGIQSQAELGQIRAGMVDANNLRYKMSINGGYKPISIGKEGLKITPERLKEAKEIAKCIRKKRSAKFNIIPEEAREAMRDVTKVPNDAVPFFQGGGQMNVIPEGSLHARLHHMENSEHITKKGIPVVDNEGRQQAEIERNEIIFRKEVTNKLEELAKDGSDEAAIEAGKLLAVEIIENTEDRTGLIEEVTEKTPEKSVKFSDGGIIDKGKIANGIVQGLEAGINTYIAGKKAKKQEELLRKQQDEENLKNSITISNAFGQKNEAYMNNGPATVDENGNVLTKEIPEIPKPDINKSNFTNLLIKALVDKNEGINGNNVQQQSFGSNLGYILKRGIDVYNMKPEEKEEEEFENNNDDDNEDEDVQGAQKGVKLPEFKTYQELLNYLKQTGRDNNEDYDLESAFNDKDVYSIWRKEEEKNPGKGHWLDKYKKDSHITYSSESILGENPKKNGGRWVNANGKDIFIVSPYLENKHSLDDYLEYFSNEEPTVGVRYKGITYFPGRRKK